MKTCLGCRESLPLSAFYTDKRRSNQAVSTCKACFSARRFDRVRRERAERDEHGKTCPACGEHKTWTDYQKNRSASDGHQSYCKPCAYAMNQRYLERNAEAVALRRAEKLAQSPDPRSKKTCTKCGVKRPLLEFYAHRGTRDGRATYCSPCQRAAAADRRAADSSLTKLANDLRARRPGAKAEASARNRRWWLRQYGLTGEQYDQLLNEQGGLCAICRRPERNMDARTGDPRRLSVDHCHKTGAVRGLLCGPCNRGLGSFDDDPDNFDRAAAYLRVAVT